MVLTFVGPKTFSMDPLHSSKTKSPGDLNTIKDKLSKPTHLPKRETNVPQMFKNASGVSPTTLTPMAIAIVITQTSQKCTPSPSSSFHGFMQIVFNKSMLIQGPQVLAGRGRSHCGGNILFTAS